MFRSSFKKIAPFLIPALLIVLIPVILIAVKTSQDLRNRASQSEPVTNQPYLYFTYNNGLLELKLNTHSRNIDGVQLVAYLAYNDTTSPAFIPTQDSFILPPPPAYLNVITNSIENQPTQYRYLLKYTAFTIDPAVPFSNNADYTIASIPLTQQRYQNTSLVTNLGYTKVIDHDTGENLNAISPISTIDIIAQDPSSPSPTPTQSIRACNQACNDATALCASPLICFRDTSGDFSSHCRNPDCLTDIDCVCDVATPTSTLTPTPSTRDISFSVLLRPDGISADSSWLPDFKVALLDAFYHRYLELPGITKSFAWDSQNNAYKITVDHAPIPENSGSFNIGIKVGQHLSHVVGPKDLSTSGQIIPVETLGWRIITGDISEDNVIDIDDYHYLAIYFNPTAPVSESTKKSDINYDGYVDIDDYNLLVQNYNPERTGASVPSFYLY